MDKELKYLFSGKYYSGEFFSQNAEDVSLTKPGGSSFSDVNVDDVYLFQLIGADHSFLVDLNDGHFEVDGIPVRMHEEGEIVPLIVLSVRLGRVPTIEDGRLRLVFLRRRKENVTFNAEREIIGTSSSAAYRIGWETMMNGKQVSRIMEID